MNYELAKELKEAGFPQELEGKFINSESDILETIYRDGSVYLPTLSELIEACGDGFWELGKKPLGELDPDYRKDWETKGFSGKVGEQRMHETRGSTPEEAVAKLWLALNNRDKEI